MPYPPNGFYEVAQRLTEQKPVTGEGRHRTVTGRAYYSAYLATCRAICDTHHLGPDGTMPHETLCMALAEFKPDAEVRELGNLLNSLRLRRVHADYKLVKELSEDTADDSMDDAKRAFELLQTVAPKLPKIDPRDNP